VDDVLKRGSVTMARSCRLLIVCVGIVTAIGFVGGGTSTASSRPSAARVVTITIPAPAGEIPSKWLSYPGPPRANVLLPAGYNPHKAYPLLVLLHGLGGNYASYKLDGETGFFDHLGAIVVMPEGGSGWYTNWWNDGERSSPAWESYELETVIPAVLARYRILPQRRYHAIAGVSMGGLGAVYLGGRLPGFFGSVASLSGFVDLALDGSGLQTAMGLESQASSHGDDDLDPVDGPTRGFYFKGHDPPLLAMNLKHTRVFESTGTGVPSSAVGAAAAEKTTPYVEESQIIYPMNQRYHAALVTAGVKVTYQVHPGGHDAPNFNSEIKAMLAWGLFKPVVTDPNSWVNDTVATDGQLWDIGYRFAHPPNQVVQFHRSGTKLSISAAGSDVTITTSGGCTIHTRTPATIHVTNRSCR
jgi:S-formylglutathione hydrolase FrmB